MTERWIKSSYSGNNGGDCIEIDAGAPASVPVRDSKDPSGPALTFQQATWTAFLTAVKAGDLQG
ncbi:DUF397 domain-containing protein [Streptomyces sp. HSW2009]|uniref:DUF397 domain-containing protein n=1 Tax=Streptomyces sp. HSW2009 TaxID=3142890 RepID=UPI0032ECAFEF